MRAGVMIGSLAVACLLAGPVLAKGKPVVLPMGGVAEIVPLTRVMNKVAAPAGTLVHIPTFRVEVVREMYKSADTAAGGGYGASHQMSTWRLDGVNEVEMQALTQALYDEFVADLKTRGYRVATPAETAADPVLAPLMAGARSGSRLESADGQSSFYAPAGLQVVVTGIDLRAAKPQGMAAFAAMSSATGQIGKITAATKAAARGELVLEPKYSLGFAELTSSSDGFGGRMALTASVSGKTGLRIIEEGTRIDAIEPKGKGVTTNAAYLDKTLLLSPAALGSATNATTGAQRSGAMVGNLIGLAAQSYGGSGSSVGMSTRAVPATGAFGTASKEGLTAVQGALLTKVLAGN